MSVAHSRPLQIVEFFRNHTFCMMYFRLWLVTRPKYMQINLQVACTLGSHLLGWDGPPDYADYCLGELWFILYFTFCTIYYYIYCIRAFFVRIVNEFLKFIKFIKRLKLLSINKIFKLQKVHTF